MKAVVGAFNQEKALVGSRCLLRGCTTSPINRFAALLENAVASLTVLELATVSVDIGTFVGKSSSHF